jgi:hypothetical protein
MNQDRQLSTLVCFQNSGAGSNKAAAHVKTETRFKEVYRDLWGTYLTIVLSFISKQGVFSPKEFVQPFNQGIKEFTQYRAFVRSSTF